MEGKPNQTKPCNMLRITNTIWISRATTYMLTEISVDLGEVVIHHEENKNKND
jgi:hypothetical protein